MATREAEHRPTRPHPIESENQPGFEPDDERRRDERSSPPPGGIDPKQAEEDKRRVDQKRGTR